MKTYLMPLHRVACRRMLLISSIVLLSILHAPAQDVDLSALYALKTYRTPSRRFVIIAPEMLACMEAGRWAEAMTDRAESLLSESLPFTRREIRIVIRPGTNVTTGTVAAVDCVPLELTRTLRGGRLVQRIVVPRLECLAGEPVRMVFCQLLLEGFWTPARARPAPVDVPHWLTVGLLRNLTREQRREDAFAMLEAWRAGRLLPLADWLRRIDREWDDARDGPVAALLMAWLAKAPKGRDSMRGLLAHVADGPAAQGDWLAAELVGQDATVSDLEVAWDKWIMRQQRKVFLPGSTPPGVLKQLTGELLLYPGAFGIPLASGIERGSGFDELIARRKAEWIGRFCHNKQMALRTLAVGRGSMFQDTIERYAVFLDALMRGKRPGRLERLLAEAESARRDLETAIARRGPDALDEAHHDNTDTEDAGRQSR